MAADDLYKIWPEPSRAYSRNPDSTLLMIAVKIAIATGPAVVAFLFWWTPLYQAGNRKVLCATYVASVILTIWMIPYSVQFAEVSAAWLLGSDADLFLDSLRGATEGGTSNETDYFYDQFATLNQPYRHLTLILWLYMIGAGLLEETYKFMFLVAARAFGGTVDFERHYLQYAWAIGMGFAAAELEGVDMRGLFSWGLQVRAIEVSLFRSGFRAVVHSMITACTAKGWAQQRGAPGAWRSLVVAAICHGLWNLSAEGLNHFRRIGGAESAIVCEVCELLGDAAVYWVLYRVYDVSWYWFLARRAAFHVCEEMLGTLWWTSFG